jgi:preprotein translocase subunit SecA
MPQLAERTALKPRCRKRLEDLERDDPELQAEACKDALEPALVPAFALVREAGRRTLGMRHFDVQLIGGIVLHEGQNRRDEDGRRKDARRHAPAVSECAHRPRRAHRHRERLPGAARRGVDGPDLPRAGADGGRDRARPGRRAAPAAYGADITYGTNNEFGFDYLRDNMKYDLADCVQRGHHFAVVDEVDSILIDEARTPLIISGPAEESTDKYYRIDKIIPKLIQDIDYTSTKSSAPPR